jgi:LPPG:FO 2-phospho-L-lactate transferase
MTATVDVSPSEATSVVGLGGGIGASRLWTALAPAVDDLTLVVNTADDLWHYGLRVCPDLDTTLYALSGRRDEARGWGVRGETWRTMGALKNLGDEAWFNLGDLDLGTHLLRTGMLCDGAGLAEVTQRLATAMGVSTRVLPMTEQEVTTLVRLTTGEVMHYEEFLVKRGAEPAVEQVVHDGVPSARPAPGVLEAIAAADLIVIAPSNPVASIAPILAVPRIRAAIEKSSAEVVAVSPIVAAVPIVDPGERRRAASRAALLAAEGVAATPDGVASVYSGLVRRFVLDTADADRADAVAALGLEPVVADTLLHLGADPAALVDVILNRLPVAARSPRPAG